MIRQFVLSNAVRKTQMPALGLGTFLMKGNEVREAVDMALFYGYRHIDTARGYGNEEGIGNVVQSKIRSGSLKRSELFLTTKIKSTYFARADVKVCLEKSLDALQTNYVDMLLIHYPWGNKKIGDGEATPICANGERELENYDLIQTWAAMEELVEAGKAGAIGLSNFSVRLIEHIWQNARIKPSNLQCECHVYLQQSELLRYCNSRNIIMTAYGPLGAPGLPIRAPDQPFPLEDATVKKVAEKHIRTTGQVLLRHLLQRNIIPLPKSTKENRLKENFEVLDFELDKNDMQELARLDRKMKIFPFVWAEKHPLYIPGEEF